jgi:mRNA interferase MazF
MNKIIQVKRGEIYYANLCPIVGSEQGGVRPVVILQNDKGNKHSNTTIVAAITSELDKPNLPTHVIFKTDRMKKKSMVLLEQIRTIDKSRLGRFVGTMDHRTMKQVDKAILISFSLDYLEELKK